MSLNNTPNSSASSSFEVYVGAALCTCVDDEANGHDGGELATIHRLCRRGVLENWSALTPGTFILGYIWVVGSNQKDYDVRLKFWDGQVELFRDGDPERIARDRDEIRDEWARRKCYLSPDMVESVIETATKVFVAGWEPFREKWLLLPANPESESADDWWGVYSQFCKFWEVGDALAWYLVRNLYGGRFFKPDLHIMAVARHFFGDAADPLAAMRGEAKRLWASMCKDTRFLPLHLGELDYFLWWHKRKNDLPMTATAVVQ